MLATVLPDGTLHRVQGTATQDDVRMVAELIDGDGPLPREVVAWLAAGFGGWELLHEDIHNINDWLRPHGGTRTVVTFGDPTKSTDFRLGRKHEKGLRVEAEMLQVSARSPGRAYVYLKEGALEAPPAFSALAERFGEDAAGKLWRFRPPGLQWPAPPRTVGGNVVMMGGRGGGPIEAERTDVGPFTWLTLTQARGTYSRTIAEVTVVDGEPSLMRELSTHHGMAKENVNDPLVAQGALEAVLRSVASAPIALEDLAALLLHLHLGEIVRTEEEMTSLCGPFQAAQNGRSGRYFTSHEGVDARALSAWRAPEMRGDEVRLTTHLGSNVIGFGSGVHGVFNIDLTLGPRAEAEVVRICDGKQPAPQYVG